MERSSRRALTRSLGEGFSARSGRYGFYLRSRLDISSSRRKMAVPGYFQHPSMLSTTRKIPPLIFALELTSSTTYIFKDHVLRSTESCPALPRLVRSGAYRPQDDAGFSWSQHFMRFLCARCVNSARPSVKRPNTKCQYYYSRNADTLCVFLCARCVNSARPSGKHLNTAPENPGT